MGYSPWGRKKSDKTEPLTHTAFMLYINLKQNKIWGQNFNPYSFELSCDLDNHFCAFLGGEHAAVYTGVGMQCHSREIYKFMNQCYLN